MSFLFAVFCVFYSKGEQKVENVKLLQREKELAEKEAQVCKTSDLCVGKYFTLFCRYVHI